MERQIGYVDVDEVKKVLNENDSNEKIAYANMIERTMIGLDGKEEKILRI